MRNHLLFVATLCLFLFAGDAFAKEIQAKDGMGRDYWLYVPDTIDPEKTYTLVVGVHGARGKGKGAAGYAGWVNKHDVIVLGPSYVNDAGAFQYLGGKTDQQTIDLFKTLSKEYKLHKKLFIVGFSGGSQYAHRFAMKYPGLVSGCAAHSGGTWATGDYPTGEKPNIKAKGVLFVISCGEKDTKKSFDQAPMGRLEWAKRYEGMLKRGGFIYDAKWWPNIGHRQGEGARQQTLDCFIASTQRLPEYDAEREAIEKTMRAKDYAGAWSLIQARMNHEDNGNDGILGRVHGLYHESLEAEITRIDRMAEREVRKILHEQRDPEKRRAALEKHKAFYAGAPDTVKAVDKELAKLK
jgi:predicted esterase